MTPTLLRLDIGDAANLVTIVEGVFFLGQFCLTLFNSIKKHRKNTIVQTIRFARLHELLQTDGLPHDKPIKDLFQEWTERLAYSPIEVGLQRNAAATDRLILKLEKSLNEYPLDKYSKAIWDRMSTVLKALKLLAQNSKYLSSLFINDPESYVDPHLYDENVDKWPAAPIIVNFSAGAGVGLDMNVDEANRNGFRILNAHASRDKSDHCLVLKMILPGKSQGVDMIDTDVAENSLLDLTLTDFYFSGFGRSNPDFNWVCQGLKKGKDYEPFFEILY